MGYTSFSVEKLEGLIQKYKPTSIIDLGAQNMYNQPLLPALYASEWYQKQGIKYLSIDLNGENNSEISLTRCCSSYLIFISAVIIILIKVDYRK